ncbi:FAD-dependent oxidoreductase [Methanonatronarchaeum sp. AMET-Sl]|uniref:NAD(P)/FAD-dependent oxidoreductase n=1 Tax=Methanonatronarchaeum sp. AMET-Sl TaxID=3037654 RepID=UPI00244D9DEB|nr:FAD-dependent oxidoreductase [Methanonatronarchaeum sp. AMET-Sl]WGI17004.1 FAD-dependent oxidoreductase [Methanonatronarchaeum sp. AMET-Sl]
MNKPKKDVCVLGGGFGGLNTALKASNNPNLDITLVSKDKYHVYTPGLKYFFRDNEIEKYRFKLTSLLAQKDIEFKQGKVVDVLKENKVVKLDSNEISYDKLVVALGGEVNSYGLDISGIEKFYSWDDALSVREKTKRASEVILVGGGYVGVELASKLSDIGLEVTVIDSNQKPLSSISERAGDKALKHFKSNQIKFIGEKRVTDVQKNSLELKDGTKMTSDLVIWAGGLKASSTVQKIFDTDNKGIKVDRYLSTEHKDIYGVGDCTDFSYNTGFNALKQTKALANNLDPKNKKMKAGEIKALFIQLGKNGLMIVGNIAIKNRLVGLYKKLEYKYYKNQLKKLT